MSVDGIGVSTDMDVDCNGHICGDATASMASIVSYVTWHIKAAGVARLRQTCSALCFAADNAAVHLDLTTAMAPIRVFARTPSVLFSGVVSIHLQFCDDLLDEHLVLLPLSLRRLTLDGCHAVTDAGIKAVASACGRRLELLSVYWNKKISDAAVLALSIRCPSLTSLSLSGCGRVSTAGVAALASRCRLLKSLNVTRLPLVDDVALVAVLQANRHVEELRLFACSQYTDAPLLSLLGFGSARLRVLDCTGLSLLSDAAVTALGACCPQLRELWLTWCKRVTDAGVCAVARGCPLELLSIHGLSTVGEESIAALAEGCHATLRAIDVRGCPRVNQRAPEQWATILPRVHEFLLHRG